MLLYENEYICVEVRHGGRGRQQSADYIERRFPRRANNKPLTTSDTLIRLKNNKIERIFYFLSFRIVLRNKNNNRVYFIVKFVLLVHKLI